MKMLGWRFWLCTFALSFYCCNLLVAGQVTDPSEVSALEAVNSNLIDLKKHLKDWKKGDPCLGNWTGVLCFDAIGADGYFHVKELLLMTMNLSGNLASELGQLSQLQILNFMWNELTGSIPKEIGNIAPLRLLLLNGNKLSGSLPDELGYLSSLDRFQIDENQISGSIPKSFSNLNRIKHIHFNNNSLSGHIPPELSNLSFIVHLLLDNNNLSGNLPPEFSSLQTLQILQLDNNNFSGAEIPASYGNMTRLIKLSLRNCSLRGSIPDLSRIQNLSYLDLSLNQLSSTVPSNLSNNMTTIILSYNQLNGSIPKSFSNLPHLQKLSLENNSLTGSVSTDIWQKRSFIAAARLLIDLENNLLSNTSGDLNPPVNVTLRLGGNPVCSNENIRNISQFCGSEAEIDDIPSNSTNLTMGCPIIGGCPTGNYYEYVPLSPIPCFCASPLRIGYRLKSPSISYFPPYEYLFEVYLTNSLNLHLYQVFIDSYSWEKGRLRMYLKLFPVYSGDRTGTFNNSEILRIRDIFTSWKFSGSGLFGPYELLNFTLLGPYSYENSETQGTKSISRVILIAIILVAITVAVIASATVTLLITRRCAKYQHAPSRKRLSAKLSIKIEGVKSFTFQELALATESFSTSTQVGQGGYGTVHKGILADKTIVAIKRAKEGSLQGQKEFLTEIELLSRLHHRNLVFLLGYCDEEGEQMLVYEFMPNGTLQDWLSGKSGETLNFGARLRIALGAAKGVLYLHTEADPPIFHRDIKASNILLDSRLTAKVADFGLSRLAPVLDDEGSVPQHVSTIVRGTPGYLDPEYFLTRKLTNKSDVYSLGVVFLEILTGRQPILHGKNIVREVNLAHQSGAVFSIIDSRMGSYPSECIERFIALALRCCQDKPEARPSMLDVVRELENILLMFSETGIVSSDSRSKYFSESVISSSSANTSRDPYLSSNVSGSDLVSGVSLTITPR